MSDPACEVEPPNKRIEQTAKAFAVILLGIVQLLIRNTLARQRTVTLVGSQLLTGDGMLPRLLASFPARLGSDVTRVYELVGGSSLKSTPHDAGSARVGGESLLIPSRLFFDEPAISAIDELSDTQALVLAALMTRHRDGFARERWAVRIAGCQENWLAPFVVQLVGERVVEIVQHLDDLGVAGLPCYHEFASENREFCRLTCARILTIWDLLYRTQTPDFSQFASYRVAREMGVWTRALPRRLRANKRIEQTAKTFRLSY